MTDVGLSITWVSSGSWLDFISSTRRVSSRQFSNQSRRSGISLTGSSGASSQVAAAVSTESLDFYIIDTSTSFNLFICTRAQMLHHIFKIIIVECSLLLKFVTPASSCTNIVAVLSFTERSKVLVTQWHNQLCRHI